MQDTSYGAATEESSADELPPAPITPPAAAAARNGGQQAAPAPAAGSEVRARSAAWMQRLQAALDRRLPPADIVQLDQGYLVVRRRSPRQRDAPLAAGGAAGWDAAQEARFQHALRHLRLLAALRLVLSKRQGQQLVHREQRFAAAVAAVLGPAAWHAHQHSNAANIPPAH